jgi:hypothetical protein
VSPRANQLIEAGLWLKMSGDVEGARRLFEQALRLDPESARARELLGQSPGEPEPVPEELRDVPKTNTDLFTVPLPRLFPDEPPPPASVPEDWWAPSELAAQVPAVASGFTTTEGVAIAPTSGSTAVWPAPAEADFGGIQSDEFNLALDWAPSPAIERTPTPLRTAPSPEQREPTPGPRGSGTMAPERKERTPGPQGGVGAGPLQSPGALERQEWTPGPPGAVGAAALPSAASEQRERTPGSQGVVAVPLLASEASERRERTPMPRGGIGALSPPSLDVPEPRERTPGPRGSVAIVASALDVPERKERTPGPLGGVAAVPLPSAAPPRDAWGGPDDLPTQLGLEEGGGDALELVTELRPATGLTPLPAPRDTRAEAVRLLERARELQGLDDHSGARELLLRAQGLHPELSGLADALLRSEAKLQTIYESKIGKLGAVPRVRLREDEVIWLNLDHRAGFMLAQIDGTLTFEDLFSVSGMSRLDTARILAQLLEQRVIVS